MVSAVLIVLWLIDLRATWLQWSLWRIDPENDALRSRLLAGALLTVGASLVAALAGMRLARIAFPDHDWALTAFAVFVLISLPQAHWLWSWWRGWS